MRGLLLATTVACIFLFLFAFLDVRDLVETTIAVLLWGVLPTPLVVFAIYARGDAQAFAIGALVPLITLGIFRFPSSISPISGALWLIPVCLICGFIAAVTHRWIRYNSRD
jgi:hypothetical protein